jgi:hypothetical protein
MIPPCVRCGFDYTKEDLVAGQTGRAHIPAEIVNDVQMFVCAIECSAEAVASPYLSLPPG